MMKKTIPFLFLFLASAAFGALSEADRAVLQPPRNLLANPGAELSKSTVTASAGTYTIETSTKRTGSASFGWDSSGAAQTLSFGSKTFPAGNNYASVFVKCDTGTCTHLLEAFDGSNVLASATILSDTANFSKTGVNFSLSTPTAITVRLKSVASNEPKIYVDDAYGGEAPNVAQVSQAFVAGSLNWAPTASCSWTTTAAFADFSADADCPTPTATGALSAPGTKVPHVVYAAAPQGKIVVTFTGTQSGGISGVNACDFRLIDDAGTTPVQTRQSMNGGGSGFSLTGEFVYTVGGSHTFRIQAAATSGNTCSLDNDAGTRGNFTVKVFPGDSQLVAQPDQIAMSWSGYHDSTCAWTITQATYAADFADDASCALTQTENTNIGTVVTFGAAKPGVTWTPKKAGTYWVCAQPSAFVDTAAVDSAVRLTDGTKVLAEAPLRRAAAGGEIYKRVPLCASYSVASTASVTLKIQGKSASNATLVDSGAYTRAIDWTIFDISQVGQVQLQNQVTTSASGGERIVQARIANAGTPTVTTQSGSWVSSLTDNGTGDVSINIAAGTFSAAPACVCTIENAGTRVCASNAATTTALFRAFTTDNAGANTDVNFSVICMGAR